MPTFKLKVSPAALNLGQAVLSAVFAIKRASVVDSFVIVPDLKLGVVVVDNEDFEVNLLPNTPGSVYEVVMFGARTELMRAFFLMPESDAFLHELNLLTAYPEMNPVVATFLQLNDTPNSYVGHAGKLVAVKQDETGIEFIECHCKSESDADPIEKKIIILGDSLSDGHLLGGINYSWPNVFCQKYDFELVSNQALNYSGFVPQTISPIPERLNTVPDDFKGYVVLHGGVNDCLYANGLLGTIDDETITTLYGSFKYSARKILDKNSILKLIIFVPYVFTHVEENQANANGWKYQQGRQASIDIYNLIAAEYPGRVLVVRADTGFTLQPDQTVEGVHPSAKGAVDLADYFAATVSATLRPLELVYTADFTTMTTGNLNGQDGWTVDSGSYVISEQGLGINAVYNVNPKGALRDCGSVRVVRILVTGKAILKLRQQSTDQYFGLWTYNDNGADIAGWNFGNLNGGTVVIYPPNGRPLDNEIYWLELEQIGGYLNARVWMENGERPMNPLATHVIESAEASSTQNFGKIGIVSTSTDMVIIKRIEVYI